MKKKPKTNNIKHLVVVRKSDNVVVALVSGHNIINHKDYDLHTLDQEPHVQKGKEGEMEFHTKDQPEKSKIIKI